MKKFRYILLALLIIPFSIFFSACSEKAYVTGIEKSKTVGSTDTYTVTYSDGTKSFFTVENGEDGKDATLTLDIIKEYCEEQNITIEEFFANHMMINVPSSTQDVTNQVLNSSVGIWSEVHSNSTFSQKQTSLYCGSGVIYEIGEVYSYIITNYHVVYFSTSIESNNIASSIHLFQYGTSEKVGSTKDTASGYKTYEYPSDAVECTYIGGSMTYDIAIIRAETADLIANNPNAKAAQFAQDHKIGEDLIAVGNPEGQGIRATYGHVAKESEYTTLTAADDTTQIDFRVIGIDVAVNGGNSGGGVYNKNGELVGIVNAKLMYDKSSNPVENISYALPIGNVEKVVESISYYYNPVTNKNSKAKRLYLGVTYKTDNYSSVQDNDTGIISLYDEMVITEVGENSLGEEISFKVGDVITKMTIQHLGEQAVTYEVSHAYELSDLMLIVRATDSVIFTYERNGVSHDAVIGSVKSSNMKEVA